MSAFLLTTDGPIATLTFNRPEKRNPLNIEVLLEMESHLRIVQDDPQVRVLIMAGTGNSFCAGADLSAVKDTTDPEERQRVFRAQGMRRTSLTARAAMLLRRLEQVTIAAINGYAVSGGFVMALACDFRIAIEQAQFWLPEVDLGVPLVPEGCQLLVEQVGPARAKEMILTCQRYQAPALKQMGLLHQVVPQAQLQSATLTLAESFVQKRQEAVQTSKATILGLTAGQSVLRTDLLLARGDHK